VREFHRLPAPRLAAGPARLRAPLQGSATLRACRSWKNRCANWSP
jgi:hypothetical protein